MRIERSRLERWAARLLAAAGARGDDPTITAEALVWCDAAGRDTHGVGRLPVLVRRLREGLFRTPCPAELELRGPSLARMDAGNGLGPVAARHAMDHAVGLAAGTGLGVVFVRGANWFGGGAPVVLRATHRGMVGLALSNSVPKVAAPGGHRPVLGTNPLALGVPRGGAEPVLVDMATSAVAGSVVRRSAREGRLLPPGVAVGPDGEPTRDPERAMEGALLPFGGAKGFALSLAVDILAGVLSGAGFGDGVRSLHQDFDGGGNTGFLVAALDPSRLLPEEDFQARIEALLRWVRGGIPADATGVRIPGELRWSRIVEASQLGVDLDEPTRAALVRLSGELGVEIP